MSSGIGNIVLTGLKRFTYEEIMKSHSSKKLAASCAEAAIKVITLNFKNITMYIPTGIATERAEICNAICAEFNGNNHAELAIKYKRSLQNIYSILKSKKTKKSKKPILIEAIADYMPIEFIRSGLSQEDAEKLAKNVTKYLQQNFPGISIYASSAANHL